ncbi:MAG: amino acid ABC transporter permease [Lachnospiraceae bacterium]
MSITTMISQLAKGMGISIEIFVVTLVFSLILGLFVCFLRMAKNPVISMIARVYISILRGTPLMLQLLVVCYGPFYIFGVKSPYDKLTAVLIGFVLNYAAYFAEIYRAGIESIPTGQYEAASLLGYNKVQTFIYIVLPQVIKRVLPPVTNETITLVKDTSLAFALTVTEMFTTAKQIAAAETSMVPFIIAAVFYYIFNLIVAVAMEYAEKKLNYYH